MGVFEVDRREFSSRLSFNQYLADNYSSLSSSDLYIVTGLTEYTQQEFLTLMQEDGYEVIEDYGAIQKVECEYDTNQAIEFYFHFSHEEGVVLFYTDMRKTEEIDSTIEPFLRRTKGVHYLFVSPRLLQDIREQIVENEPAVQISEFIAKRTERTEADATLRPEFARTINYYGDDGLETLREMERNYGVLPRIMEFNVPGGLQFRVSREGIFTLQKGALTDLFEYLQMCIEEALEVKRHYQDANFDMVPVSDQLSVAASEPAAISLRNTLEYHEIGKFKASLRDNNYVLLDSYAEEGSLFFSSKVIDEVKNSSFRVKANEDEIRVFPQDEKDLGAFYRYFEFIQDNIDERAELTGLS